jgi:hypothetical protein
MTGNAMIAVAPSRATSDCLFKALLLSCSLPLHGHSGRTDPAPRQNQREAIVCAVAA